jgi:hypothetical protein
MNDTARYGRHQDDQAEREGSLTLVKEAFDSVTALPRAISEFGGLRRRRKMKKRLRAALSDPRYEWRNLDTRAHLVGLTEEETRPLLVEIDARPSLAQDQSRQAWGLISRVGRG